MIFISAGHYASAPGARWERFIEHDEAVIWAEYLTEKIAGSMLVPSGILKSKVGFINERVLPGDFAIEIHFNAARDRDNNPVGRGCESLYFPGSEKGKTIATLCQMTLAEFFPPDRGVKEGWYRMDPSNGPDFFLAKTKCPAVIIEPDFVHRGDLIRANREAATTSLAIALSEYVGLCEKNNG